MSKENITGLPHPVIDEIARSLNPLPLANLGRAFASAGFWFNFRKDYKQAAKIWDIVFKDETWLQTVSSLRYDYAPSPNPALIGSGLERLYYGATWSPVYLALIISDWGGDAVYAKEQLFTSFREQDYTFDEELSEVRFKKSGIILHIGDAIKSEEWIEMKEPSRLFRCHRKELQTAALYYHSNHLYRIGSDQIGGIEDFSTRRKKRVKYICSIRLRLGNGDYAHRVMKKSKLPIRLVSQQVKVEGKRRWATSWRVANAGERDFFV